MVSVAHPEVPTMLRISARGFYLPDEVFWWRGSCPLTTQKDSGWLWAWSLGSLENPAIGGTRALHQQALDGFLRQVRCHVVLWGLKILELYVCIFPLNLEIFSRCYFSKFFPLLSFWYSRYMYIRNLMSLKLCFFFLALAFFLFLLPLGSFSFLSLSSLIFSSAAPNQLLSPSSDFSFHICVFQFQSIHLDFLQFPFFS